MIALAPFVFVLVLMLSFRLIIPTTSVLHTKQTLNPPFNHLFILQLAPGHSLFLYLGYKVNDILFSFYLHHVIVQTHRHVIALQRIHSDGLLRKVTFISLFFRQ